jgi:hypothetical protein
MTAFAAALGRARWHTVLRSRAVLAVEGADARAFLQGLVTNDMTAVHPGAPAHVAFLNRTGRVLCDAHVSAAPRDGERFLIECDGAARGALHAHLRKFRLRADVAFVELDPAEHAVVVFGGPAHVAASLAAASLGAGMAARDPRRAELGWRAIVSTETLASGALAQAGSSEVPVAVYELTRTLLAVAEGLTDLPSAEALPAEANLDVHRAICFTKGCYLGQELTARTHFTGVVRKRALPVVLLAHDTDADAADAADGAAEAAVRADEWPVALAHLPNWCKRPSAAAALRALATAPTSAADAPLAPPGAAIALAADDSAAPVGKLHSSVCGAIGLAVLRFEKLLPHGDVDLACAAGGRDGAGVRLRAVLPPWVQQPTTAPAAAAASS